MTRMGDQVPAFNPDIFLLPAQYRVDNYGAKGDGVTNDSAAVIAAMNAANAAGGGAVIFSAKSYLINSQLLIPSAAGKQNPIAFIGAGCRKNGVETTDNALGGTTLILNYVGTGGKIQSEGDGSYFIRDLHMTQTAGATDATPFVFSTHSTPHIERVSVAGYSTLGTTTCIQDAFVFGNTGGAGDVPPWFAGYGGYVRDVEFDRIRSGVAARKAFNAFLCQNLTFSWLCGSNNTQGAIDLDGMGDQNTGNTFVNCIIECQGYPYPIRLNKSNRNCFYGTTFWDETATLLFLVKIENGSYDNMFIGGSTGSIPEAKFVTGGTSYLWLMNGSPLKWGIGISSPEDKLHVRGANTNGNTEFGSNLGIIMQNNDATAGNFTSLVNKSSGGNATAGVFFKNQDHAYAGLIDLCTRSLAGELGTRLRIWEDGRAVFSKGGIDCLRVNGAHLAVTSTTGGFAPPRMTTAQRDAITTPAEGVMVYNLTTHTLDFYNGTAWKQVAGV